MSGLKILTEAVNSDPGRFRWLFGLAPYPYPLARLITDAPAAEAEAPAAGEAPEAEAGSEDAAPAGEAEAAGPGEVQARGAGCICIKFGGTGGYRIADVACPVHGLGGTQPAAVILDHDAAGRLAPPAAYGHQSIADAVAAKGDAAGDVR